MDLLNDFSHGSRVSLCFMCAIFHDLKKKIVISSIFQEFLLFFENYSNIATIHRYYLQLSIACKLFERNFVFVFFQTYCQIKRNSD